MAMKKKGALTAADLSKEGFIRRDYAAFLKETGTESSPERAYVFAVRAINQGQAWGFTEREIILLCAKELPYMYG